MMPVYHRIGRYIFDTHFGTFLQTTKSVLVEIGNISSSNTTLDLLEILADQLDDISRSFSLIVNETNERSQLWTLCSDYFEHANQIRSLLSRRCEDMNAKEQEIGYACPQSHANTRGRPRYAIQESRLEFLCSKHFP